MQRRFVSPSSILCASWAVVFVLQSVFAPDMYSSLEATATIFVISSAFVVGELFGRYFAEGLGTSTHFDLARIYHPGVKSRFALMVFLFGLLSIVGAARYIRALGLFEVGSFAEALLSVGAVRAKIFTGEISVSLVDRLGFLLAYSGVVLSISYWYFYGWRWWLILPSFSVFVLGAAQAGRAGTLIILLQWIIAFLLKARRSPVGYVFRVLCFVAIVFGVFWGGQLLREGFADAGAGVFSRVAQMLRSYLFGGISAFAVYIDYIFEFSAVTFGKYSFSSLFAALGLYPQAPGVYDQYVMISASGDVTNIFTAYRSFVDDFTVVGACVVYLLAGLGIGCLYYCFVRGFRLYISILVPALSWLAFSPLYSITYFNSMLLSFVLPFFVLKCVLRSPTWRLRGRTQESLAGSR